MREEEIKRKKELLKEFLSGKKPVMKKKAPNKKEVDADVNKDGVVDEKDVEEVKKKIKKKKS